MKVLIDNGHGSNTTGKRSPDGRLREYAYAREIAGLLVEKLKKGGVDAELVTPETYDVSLATRVSRINRIYRQMGNRNCIAISIHNDAKGSDNKWHEARGFSVRVAPNASKNSKRLAKIIYEQAVKAGLKGNRATPPEGYWVQNLAICRDTSCPAVLTENLFQDNKEDVEFLLSDKGKETIVNLHYNAIMEYIKGV